MNTTLVLAPTLALLAATLAGCDFQLGSSTQGEQGHATFSYESGDGCFFGCDTGRPMMAGTTESIGIDGDSLPDGLTIVTDDPAVITATLEHSRACCTTSQNGGGCSSLDDGGSCAGGTIEQIYTADVTAVGPGDGTLEVHAADGSLFDAVALHVSAPASLSFSCDTANGAAGVPVAALDVAAGQSCAFSVEAFDADGDQLQASAGFSISSADPAIAVVHPAFFFDLGLGMEAPVPPVTDSDGSVDAVAPGTTTISITTGALTQEITVTVP